MQSLDAQLKKVREEESQVLKKIEERNKQKKIQCASCEKAHKIGRLRAIQTHFYISPHGCTGGDYWLEGEMKYICPTNDTINRLLFNSDDVPYEYDPEEQFKTNYKHLFKEVTDRHGKEDNRNWVNNYYIDKNRRKFGLVEKKQHKSKK